MSCRISSIFNVFSHVVHRPSSLLIRSQPQFIQQRYASILSSLSDNPGAYNKRIRRGRGPGSGKGKTSGRGHGGQKQKGKVPYGFQGGQKPLEIVHGTRGFKNQYVMLLAL
jgi:large subunit ribosomal protein L15